MWLRKEISPDPVFTVRTENEHRSISLDTFVKQWQHACKENLALKKTVCYLALTGSDEMDVIRDEICEPRAKDCLQMRFDNPQSVSQVLSQDFFCVSSITASQCL